MQRLHELRLVQARPLAPADRSAKVIDLRSRRAARLERLTPPRPPRRPAA